MSQLLDFIYGPEPQGTSSTIGSIVGGIPSAASQSGGSQLRPANVDMPLTLGSPGMQLDGPQQFRIQQAMRDLNRINAAKGKTAYSQQLQSNQAQYDNQVGQINSSNALQQLRRQMGFNDQMMQLDTQQSENAQNLFGGLISPLLQMMQSDGGFGDMF